MSTREVMETNSQEYYQSIAELTGRKVTVVSINKIPEEEHINPDKFHSCIDSSEDFYPKDYQKKGE